VGAIRQDVIEIACRRVLDRRDMTASSLKQLGQSDSVDEDENLPQPYKDALEAVREEFWQLWRIEHDGD
jgi:hypothetical protein